MDAAMMRRLEERLVRYARVDTQSDDSSATVPTTARQLDLQRVLQAELVELGASDVRLNDAGFVLATIPGNVRKPVPTVALLAHVDTASDYAASNVQPIVHRAYDGGCLVLPGNPDIVIDPATDRTLASRRGDTLITADGKTLLGADDKAGVAVIVSVAELLLSDPSIPHGDVRICFTPDEETGSGIGHLALEELAADVAYTLDGEAEGEVTYESFSADQAVIRIQGVAIHPGKAKGRMVNALTLAAKLLGFLPQHARTPETTDGRDGFIHLVHMQGTAADVELTFILRDFELAGLEAHGHALQAATDAVAELEPRAKVTCTITRQYRNMRYWLEKDMRPAELALEAVRRAGVTPTEVPVRGGTDGSQLTERGLPTPNLFAGYHNAHGPQEWASVEEMAKAVETCVHLLRLWSEERVAAPKSKNR